jgi:hypothetical protein
MTNATSRRVCSDTMLLGKVGNISILGQIRLALILHIVVQSEDGLLRIVE